MGSRAGKEEVIIFEELFWKAIILLKRKKTFVRIYKMRSKNYKIEIEEYERPSKELEKILEDAKISQDSKSKS